MGILRKELPSKSRNDWRCRQGLLRGRRRGGKEGVIAPFQVQHPACLIHHWEWPIPKSLHSQAPAAFGSLKDKAQIGSLVLWLEVREVKNGEKNQSMAAGSKLVSTGIHRHFLSLPNYKVQDNWSQVAYCNISRELSWKWWEETSRPRENYIRAMLLGWLCLWSVLGAGKPAWSWTAQRTTQRAYIVSFARWSAQYEFCSVIFLCKWLSENCETFSTKTTDQNTDDAVWTSKEKSSVSTIPLGVLVRAAVNLKTISRLLASLRHGKAGPASQPCARREPGCFWNGSRFVLVSGTAHCFPARPRWISHPLALAASADFPRLIVASVTGRHF